jgi:hypothetical protein
MCYEAPNCRMRKHLLLWCPLDYLAPPVGLRYACERGREFFATQSGPDDPQERPARGFQPKSKLLGAHDSEATKCNVDDRAVGLRVEEGGGGLVLSAPEVSNRCLCC